MDLEQRLREVILDELRRQLEGRGRVEVDETDKASVQLEGRVDIDALAMVIAGSMAGGP